MKEFVKAAMLQTKENMNPAKIQMDLVKEGVEIADKAIDVAKKIEVVDAIDKAFAAVVEACGGKAKYALRTPQDKVKDLLMIADLANDVFPNAVGSADVAMGTIINVLAEDFVELHDVLKDKMKQHHGSKVKADEFEGCRIIYAGDRSYIKVPKKILTEDGKKEIEYTYFYLTPQFVRSCTFDRKIPKPHKAKVEYYFNIEFKGGAHSYIRVSRKHLKNMEKLGAVIKD